MGKQVKDLRKEIDDTLSDFRRIKYIIDSDEFEHFYNTADEDEQNLITFFIFARRVNFLRRAIRSKFPSYFQLRNDACRRNIPNYSRMSKEELLLAISASEKKEQKDGCDTTCSCSTGSG